MRAAVWLSVVWMNNHFSKLRVIGWSVLSRNPGENEVEKIVQAVAQMDKKEFQSKMYLTYVDHFQIPLGIAIIIILLETYLSDFKRSNGPPGKLSKMFDLNRLRRDRVS